MTGTPHPVVACVLAAVEAGNRALFYRCFASSATLSDDGQRFPLRGWAEREIFVAGGRILDPTVDGTGLVVRGRFISTRWRLQTVWRFAIARSLVTSLDVSAV